MLLVQRKWNVISQGYADYITDVTDVPRSGVIVGFDATLSFNLSGTGDLSDTYRIGDQIFIFILIETADNVKYKTNLTQNAFDLGLNYLEKTPATPANVWFIDDVMRQIVNVIGNNQYALRSSFYERKNIQQIEDGCGSLRVETNGYQIRQFEVADRPLKIDFKTILKSLNAQDCIGINYNSNTVRVERRDFFYRDKQILAIGENIKSYREEVATEFLPNEIEYGYTKFKESGYNSLDEFNTKSEALTPIKKNKRKLSILSDFIKSGYAIEETRRNQFSETPSSSVSNDEDNFEINVVRSGGSYATEKNENFSTVNNLLSPGTVYNLRSSPHRNLFNWFIWLKGIFFFKHDTDLIKNTSVIQNGKLQTQFDINAPCRIGDLDRNLITENQNDFKTALASTKDIYRPEWVYFACRLTPDRVNKINKALSGEGDKAHGYIMVQKPDSTWQSGWVYSLSYNYSQEDCEIKMLKKYPSPDQPEDENCCEWLMANDCYILANGVKIVA